MLVGVITVIALAAGSPVSYHVTDLTAQTFARPPREDRPWVRWNLPDGTDTAQLQAELEEMARSGIAGAEIGQRGFPAADQLAAILTRSLHQSQSRTRQRTPGLLRRRRPRPQDRGGRPQDRRRGGDVR